MDDNLRLLVWRRAGFRCEYCQMLQENDDIAFEIDHIIAESHGGPSVASNLALACFHCNCFKGPNLAGIDEKTKQIVKLYNPRRHRWARHFHWLGLLLIGKTPIGRATVSVLRINLIPRVLHREALMEEGIF